MQANMSEKSIRQMVKTYYRQRAERLHTLRLDTITAFVPDSLWWPESEWADQVVTRLIQNYLEDFEDWWRDLIRDPDFCLVALRLSRLKLPQRYVYEAELAYARNRLTLAFINQYCTADYKIDWRKIIVFNSGAD